MNPMRISNISKILAAMIFLASTIIASCQVPSVSDITGITPTPMTPSPTPRVCPDVSLDGLQAFRLSRTFIVILFDPNSTNGSTLEYVDEQGTSDVLSFVGVVLPKMLGPGSQYSIFSLGFRTYEAAKLDRYTSKISEAPEIVATPIPHLTLTPVPTPTLSSVVLQHQEAKNQYNATVTAQYATATQLAFEDTCQRAAYDNTHKATATQWSVTQQAEAIEIATQVETARLGRESNVAVIETPFALNNVYEGLSHVTLDFEARCRDYERCVLILFDDLTDWRAETPDYLHINLENVEIVSVLPQCQDMIQPSCTSVMDRWTPLFESYGPKSIEYHNGERLEEFLLSYLGGR